MQILVAVLQGLVVALFVLLCFSVAGFDAGAPPVGRHVRTPTGSGLWPTPAWVFAVALVAHATAALLGAHVAAELAPAWRRPAALGVGLVLFVGAAALATASRAPTWFHVVDVTLASVPFAVLGALWSERRAG